MQAKKTVRLVYNSPVVLTFAILATLVLAADYALGGWFIPLFFMAGPFFLTPFGIILHILGHGSFQHLFSNFVMILLVGPLLEEKYGSKKILFMIFATALFTGVLNSIFFSTVLLGSSGIVFMMLILASFANARAGEIPVTFIFTSVFYIGSEIRQAFQVDSISHFAHIIGGVAGGIFGLWFAPRDSKTV